MPEATLAMIFVTSFLVGLSGAMAPGPLLTFDISEAAKRGFWAGPLISSGHAALELLVVVALAQGISQVLDQGIVGATVALLGGLFLLWMGFGLLRSAPHQSLHLEAQATASGGMSPLLGGALVSLSNPFWTLWWISIGATYVFWSLQQGVAGLSFFYMGHILADFSWYGLVSFLIATGRRFMREGFYRGVLALCGLFLLLLGGFFLWRVPSLLSGG